MKKELRTAVTNQDHVDYDKCNDLISVLAFSVVIRENKAKL